jgi:hypothetical protein
MRDIVLTGLPTRAVFGPKHLRVELRDIGPEHLIDSFMQETVDRVPSQRTIIEIEKADLPEFKPEASPKGLIFHVARCGSTLVSQLLRLHEQLVIYPEPAPVNDIFYSRHGVSRSDQVGALRAVAACFARHAGKPYVLKLSSWNSLFCGVLVEAFPSTPWAFCVRDPVEVCVSLIQRRPAWVQNPTLFPEIIDPHEPCGTIEDHVARFYAAFCKSIGKLDSSLGKLIRYEALPAAVWTDLTSHFGIMIDDRIKERMSAKSRAYSKAPVGEEKKFVGDGAKKRTAASPELHRAVDILARPELEKLLA